VHRGSRREKTVSGRRIETQKEKNAFMELQETNEREIPRWRKAESWGGRGGRGDAEEGRIQGGMPQDTSKDDVPTALQGRGGGSVVGEAEAALRQPDRGKRGNGEVLEARPLED